MTKKILGSSLLLCALLGSSLNAKCTTQNEALNKMMSMNVHSQELKNAYQDIYNVFVAESNKRPKNIARLTKLQKELKPKMKLYESYSMEVASVGKVLGNNNYTKACEMYENIAKKYHFDLTTDEKKTIKVEDLNKKATMCTPMEADMLAMSFINEAREKTNGKFTSTSDYQTLMKNAGKSLQNPDAACEIIKKMAPKYGISVEAILEKNKALFKRKP